MRATALLAFFLATSISFAGGRITVGHADEAPHPIDVEYQECLKTFTTTQEWRECVGTAATAWRALMKQQFDALRAKLDPEKRAYLEASQSTWQEWFEADTKFVNSFDDLKARIGSGGLVVLSTHRMLQLRERALDLAEYGEVLGSNTP